jgi:hypothetical protein
MNFIPVEESNAVVFWGLTSSDVEVEADVSDKPAAAVSRFEGTVSKLFLT